MDAKQKQRRQNEALKMAENRKPLSLNERANLLLQDLSRSRAAKPPPPQGEEKVHKVRLEGRRRLCKISTEPTVPDCGSINYFSFDSPPDTKKNGGEEQIRDILNGLTSRLECLSMEKSKRDASSKVQSDGEEFGSANSSLASGSSPDEKAEVEGGKCKRKEVEDVVLEDFKVENVEKKVEDKGGRSKGKGVEEEVLEDLEDEDSVLRRDDSEELLRRGRSDVVDLSDDDSEIANCVDHLEEERRDENLEDDQEEGTGDIVMEGSGKNKSMSYTLPGHVAGILYPHQREGLRWLWSLHCGGTGGILGDDMGLGKTMQISSYLAGLFHSRLIKRALVVAPKTLLAHWIKELSIVGLSSKIKDYYGTSSKMRNYELDLVLKDGGVLLTTYDIVRNNFKTIRGDFYCHGETTEDEIIWDYVILDEGHIIKNLSTQRAKGLLEIPSSHRVIISGTPIQNNLKELWALFYFCCPQILGDKKEFKEKYEYKILRGNEKVSSDREKYIGSSVAKELRERIKPYFLRRLKSEVFAESNDTSEKLSRKNELIVWIRLSQTQRKLYEAFLKSELVSSSITGSPLAAITILKKICDHPLLLTKRAAEEVMEGLDTMLNKDDIGLVEDMTANLLNMTQCGAFQQVDNTVSCKIRFMMPLLENLVSNGHNVLIFSQTRKMLNFIQEAVVSEGYTFLRIDGTTKISERERIVKDFQAGAAPIFLLTSRVGGLGLTLTRADRVIVADPAWNPSTDNQSVDRAYRIGQKKDVLVYRLMTCGTIEEKIYKMQVYKGGLFKIATEQKDQTRYFSKKDLQELFSLPKEGFDVSLTQRQMHEEHDHQQEMDKTLINHIGFLEKQGIAGVSHHSMLFSKTANVPLVHVDEEEQSTKRNIIAKRGSSSFHFEDDINGAEFAFNPKTERTQSKMNSQKGSPVSAQSLRKEIEDSIRRLCQTLTNNAIVSHLPDKGDKIRHRISQLRMELSEIDSTLNQARDRVPDVVDLDDLAVNFEKGLRV